MVTTTGSRVPTGRPAASAGLAAAPPPQEDDSVEELLSTAVSRKPKTFLHAGLSQILWYGTEEVTVQGTGTA